ETKAPAKRNRTSPMALRACSRILRRRFELGARGLRISRLGIAVQKIGEGSPGVVGPIERQERIGLAPQCFGYELAVWVTLLIATKVSNGRRRCVGLKLQHPQGDVRRASLGRGRM